MPAGSNLVKVNASTNSSNGTPYCSPTADGDGEVVHHRAEAGTLFVHVDENLAQGDPSEYSPVLRVNLVATDHTAFWVYPLRRSGIFSRWDLDDFLDNHLLDNLLG